MDGAELAALIALLRHPDPLVTAALAANTPSHIGGVGAVLEVVAAGCHEGGLQLGRPLVVSPGEPKHSVGGQAEVPEHRAKWLTSVDGVEELLPYFDG